MATELLNRRVVRVPDVVGRALGKAQILLEDAGLVKIVTLYRESYEDRDTVLEQRPVVSRLPDAPASRCFRRLALRVANWGRRPTPRPTTAEASRTSAASSGSSRNGR